MCSLFILLDSKEYITQSRATLMLTSNEYSVMYNTHACTRTDSASTLCQTDKYIHFQSLATYISPVASYLRSAAGGMDKMRRIASLLLCVLALSASPTTAVGGRSKLWKCKHNQLKTPKVSGGRLHGSIRRVHTQRVTLWCNFTSAFSCPTR